MRRSLLPLRDRVMDVSHKPMAANAGAGITCAFQSAPHPPPKTSLRLIQRPALLFFTSKSDVFSSSEMDGGSDDISFVRKARGKLWTPIIIYSFPGASLRSVPPFVCLGGGHGTEMWGGGGGRRLGEEPGEVRGITSLMFCLGWATELQPQMGEISLSILNSSGRGKRGGGVWRSDVCHICM